MAAEQSGREYLARHRVAELLHGLGALLLHHRPERPREFLIQALERIKLAKQTGVDYPYLMDEPNLEAMFEMLDTASQGYITLVQYKEALKTLGLSAQDVSYEDGTNITLEVFKEEVKKKMLASWVVY
ncbi:PREDICTED: EF-hand calcium-binding domain-containing protein 10-like [Crocodylus porosus]|uniref:EF-hand calcium-binding domain-containing protein 10-like n=1 Tax=Crocodylus porosus TaxID=8502 RepID=UPI00093D101B|nr:PREDICTED: EF-hand calcium-binding domain-containing protein 10-like [Crocodylus porosus]